MTNKIDWFSIDMDAFQEKYDEYVTQVQTYEAAVARAAACENGTCTHERRLKKDGTPHKGVPCPQGHAMYELEVRAGNALHFGNADLFEAIGLGVRTNV